MVEPITKLSMQKHLSLYFIAQSFLTRLPVPVSEKKYTNKQIGRSALYYPVVGLLIGAILGTISWGLSFANPAILAVIVTTLWVIITGALHLDGLADSADAWLGGHGNKARIFSIMDDPRLGTAGVVSLILLLLLKATSLFILIQHAQWGIIILAPMIARLATIAFIFFLPCSKNEGLAYTVKENLPTDKAFAILIILSIFLIFIAPLMFIFSLLIFWLLKQMMLKQIDGMTGDTLGASIEIIEAIGLMTMALLV